MLEVVLKRVLANLIGSNGRDGTLVDELSLLRDVVGHDVCLLDGSRGVNNRGGIDSVIESLVMQVFSIELRGGEESGSVPTDGNHSYYINSKRGRGWDGPLIQQPSR